VAPPHDPLNHEHDADDDHGRDFGRGHHHHLNADGDDVEGESAESVLAGETTDKAVALSITGANPSSQTSLRFDVVKTGHVSLKIFDVQGRTVRTLVDQDAAPGSFVARWDGRSDDGARSVAGVYFVRLSSAGQTTERKVVLQ
jgi:flagellar hook assembly protein FlgD